MKISIIIPVYNVYNYLEKCIDSILKSKINFKNIEILLIDDGSTDESSKLIDILDKKYDFIHGFHKTNGGLSDARNYGLNRAIGEYVIFIDSDDEVEPIAFCKIINKIMITKSDVVLWDASMINEVSKQIDDFNNYYKHNGLKNGQVYNGIETIINQLDKYHDFATTVWLGAYRKEFLIDNNLYFQKGILHEDELWTIVLLINANSIDYVEKNVYLYRLREDSIMNKKDKKYERNVNDIIYIYSLLFSYIDWKISDEKIAKKIKGNIAKRFIHALLKFEIYRYKKSIYKINKNQLFMNSNRLIDKIRVIIFVISPYLFCKLFSR